MPLSSVPLDLSDKDIWFWIVCAYRDDVNTMTFPSTQLFTILSQVPHADLDKGEARWGGHIVGHLKRVLSMREQFEVSSMGRTVV